MNDQYIVVPAAGAGFFAMIGQSLLTVAIAFLALYILFWYLGRVDKATAAKEKENEKSKNEKSEKEKSDGEKEESDS